MPTTSNVAASLLLMCKFEKRYTESGEQAHTQLQKYADFFLPDTPNFASLFWKDVGL